MVDATTRFLRPMRTCDLFSNGLNEKMWPRIDRNFIQSLNGWNIIPKFVSSFLGLNIIYFHLIKAVKVEQEEIVILGAKKSSLMFFRSLWQNDEFIQCLQAPQKQKNLTTCCWTKQWSCCRTPLPPSFTAIIFKGTFHSTISMRGQHATGKIQTNNYHHWTDQNFKNRWNRCIRCVKIKDTDDVLPVKEGPQFPWW